MQITASQTRPGDLVRGIGLVITSTDYDENTNEAKLYGYVVTDRDVPEAQFATGIHLPGPHKLNVRRAYQPGDMVTVPSQYLLSLEEQEALDLADDESELPVIEPFRTAVVGSVNTEHRFISVQDVNGNTADVPFRRARHTGVNIAV